MNSETSTNPIAFNLLQKARNKFESKDYAAALLYCQAALAIYKEIGDEAGVGYALTNIANIYRRQAVESYNEALLTFQQHSIQISEDIAQSIKSTLETQLDWYASNNGNTELLEVTNPDEYWGDNRPSKSDLPTNGDGGGGDERH